MTFKQFKTKIRKLIGYVGVGEFVKDPVAFNAQKSWESLYANPRFLKQYVSVERMAFYKECFEVLDKNKVFDHAQNILDVGCGMGHFLQTVSKSNLKLDMLGTDFSEEGLQIARVVVPNAKFVKNDVLQKNNEWINKFDVVCCFEVLEHLLNPEDALQNLISYVKPSGRLVLGVPNGRLDTYEGHIQFWSLESWEAFLKRNLQISNGCLHIHPLQGGVTILTIICK